VPVERVDDWLPEPLPGDDVAAAGVGLELDDELLTEVDATFTGALAVTGALTVGAGATFALPTCTVPSEPTADCPGPSAAAGPARATPAIATPSRMRRFT